MSLTRLNLLEHVRSQGKTPLCDEFRQICHEWLSEKFPSLTENDLVDGKTREKWLDYISGETVKRWKLGNNDWKPMFGQRFKKFFEIEIKISTPEQPPTLTPDLELDMNKDNDMDMDVDQPLIDLADLTAFQVFVCPQCDFKSNDRILFKTHVIKNHEYVKGEFKIGINSCCHITMWKF